MKLIIASWSYQRWIYYLSSIYVSDHIKGNNIYHKKYKHHYCLDFRIYVQYWHSNQYMQYKYTQSWISRIHKNTNSIILKTISDNPWTHHKSNHTTLVSYQVSNTIILILNAKHFWEIIINDLWIYFNTKASTFMIDRNG